MDAQKTSKQVFTGEVQQCWSIVQQIINNTREKLSLGKKTKLIIPNTQNSFYGFIVLNAKTFSILITIYVFNMYLFIILIMF
jgi:hypothetical protein